MTVGIMYALILAGGKGERLRPLTDSIPKPMVLVNGKPLLWHQIIKLKGEGIKDFIILCSYLWESIRDHFGDGSEMGLRIQYSVEETPLGRGGGLRQGMRLVPQTEKFVISMNGDVLTDQSLEPLVTSHQRSGARATMMLTPYPNSYGVVKVANEGQVLAFDEKAPLPFWIHAGFDILDRDLETELPKLGDHETTTLPRLAREGSLYGVKCQAFWQSIDGFKDLERAEKVLSQTKSTE